jgi:hypothetical protein
VAAGVRRRLDPPSARPHPRCLPPARHWAQFGLRSRRSCRRIPRRRCCLAGLAYQWRWPNDVAKPGRVAHTTAVPPVPELVRISVGDHPRDRSEQPFDRMSFTFTAGFPSYRFEFVDQLISDRRGQVIPLKGLDVLRIVFTDAQAHTATVPVRLTVSSQPDRPIGYHQIADYAQGGDYAGVLSYGLGINRPIPQSNPQIPVRAYEIEQVTATGQHQYVVAIDVGDVGGLASPTGNVG